MGEDEANQDGGRRVRFHGRVQFKTIRHVKDFSDEEIREGWYRKRDFARMSEEVNQVAELVANGQTKDGGEELCTRGLEHLIEEEVADYRAEKMIQSVDAVLDEQDDQRYENVCDHDVIAKMYGEIAAPLQQEAYLIALRDALDVSGSSEEIDAEVQALMEASQSARVNSTTTTSVAKPSSSNTTTTRDTAPAHPAKRLSSPAAAGRKTSEQEIDATSNEIGEATPPPPPPPPADELDDSSPEKLPEMINELKIEKKAGASPSATNKKKLLMKKKEDPGTGTQALASPAPPAKKKTVLGSNEKPTPTKRKKLDRSHGTEMTPLIRRRDGTFTFRNKDLELEKMELSANRKARVRNSLFRLIDGAEEESEAGGVSIRDSMKKFIDQMQVEEPEEKK